MRPISETEDRADQGLVGRTGDHDQPHRAKVLTVSDSVAAGGAADRSGPALVEVLQAAGFEVVESTVSPDGVAAVAGTLTRLCAGFSGLIVTTGGTGFGPRDLTPEGTAEVIERDAPGVAEAMRQINPLGRLSRARAGIRGHSIILNTPGSPTGAVEALQAVMDVLPHALDLLAERPVHHPHASFGPRGTGQV